MEGFRLYLYERQQGATVADAQIVATTVLVVLEAFYLLACRSLLRPVSKLGILTNKWIYCGIGGMLLLQDLFINSPTINALFSTSLLEVMQVLCNFGAGILLFVIVSVEKHFRYEHNLKN